jgi:N-acetylmuramoyl-L-alanine amidase
VLLTAWPADEAKVHLLPLPATPVRKVRVYIDAGHGAPGNEGNHGCHCQLEQEHTLQVAQHLAFVLADSGRFEVRLSRQPGESPLYRPRIADAERFRADVIISLHSDSRGEASAIAQDDGGVCLRKDDAPGFAVLWNDEGPAFPGREKLGRAVGSRLREAGFFPYTGVDYGDLYRHDAEETSGWIDTRPMKQRVFFLRGSSIPTVIIETHHALDPQEVARWGELSTVDAFAFAVGAAVLDVTH